MPSIVVDAAPITPVQKQNGHANGRVEKATDVDPAVTAASPTLSPPLSTEKEIKSEANAASIVAPAPAPVAISVQPESEYVIDDTVVERHAEEQEDKKAKETVEPPPPGAQEKEKEKKRQNALVRTVWTLIMIGGFLCKLHAYFRFPV